MPAKEIPREQWVSFFDSFNQRHKGWLVTTEMLSSGVTHHVEARELPLEGIIPELDDQGEGDIEIIVGGKPESHISHTVSAPTHIWLQQTAEGADEAVEIQSESGAVVLRFRAAVLPELVDAM